MPMTRPQSATDWISRGFTVSPKPSSPVWNITFIDPVAALLSGERRAHCRGCGDSQYSSCFPISRVTLNDRNFSERDIRIPRPFHLGWLYLAHTNQLQFFLSVLVLLCKKPSAAASDRRGGCTNKGASGKLCSKSRNFPLLYLCLCIILFLEVGGSRTRASAVSHASMKRMAHSGDYGFARNRRGRCRRLPPPRAPHRFFVRPLRASCEPPRLSACHFALVREKDNRD